MWQAARSGAGFGHGLVPKALDLFPRLPSSNILFLSRQSAPFGVGRSLFLARGNPPHPTSTFWHMCTPSPPAHLKEEGWLAREGIFSPSDFSLNSNLLFMHDKLFLQPPSHLRNTWPAGRGFLAWAGFIS